MHTMPHDALLNEAAVIGGPRVAPPQQLPASTSAQNKLDAIDTETSASTPSSSYLSRSLSSKNDASQHAGQTNPVKRVKLHTDYSDESAYSHDQVSHKKHKSDENTRE